MSDAQPLGRERLDVESPDDRNTRLGNLLSSISQTSPSAAPPTAPPISPGSTPGPSRPFAVPQSDVLARARDFLPLLQASNEELLARAAANPESVDIEKPDGGRVIAMDLGLGVFDAPQNPGLHGDLGPVVDSTIPPRPSDDSEAESDTSSSPSSTSSSDSESDSESDTGDAGTANDVASNEIGGAGGDGIER